MESAETLGDDSRQLYDNAEKYWASVPSTVDGMLGGYSHISSTDIGGSKKFLLPFIKGKDALTKTSRALDCGAGIGRVTKLLLTSFFDKVDMVEVNQAFLDQTPAYLGDRLDRLGSRFCSGLQNFIPEEGRYDVIWSQWVLGHLSDDDLVQFLRRCQAGLATDGVVIIKENVTSSSELDFDEQDSSYTRPRDVLVCLIEKSGLKIIQETKQTNFPAEIYPVYMLALR